MSILVIAPLESEMEALSAAFDERGLRRRNHTIGRLSVRTYDGAGITLARGGVGKAQFGVQAQHLIDHAGSVDLVVCAGTAGGLHSALTIGDVVVGTATVEHDFRRGMSERPLPRFEGHAPVLKALRDASPPLGSAFSVHFGLIVSGDEDIVDATRAAELREATGAFAVAWEGAGGARAAQFSGLPYIEIRGISDGANEDAPTDFHENIPLAMKNAATVISSVADIVNAGAT